MKYTDWFPGDVKPVMDGVYQRNFHQNTLGKCTIFSLFKNGVWHFGEQTAWMAKNSSAKSEYQAEWWRGLAEKP